MTYCCSAPVHTKKGRSFQSGNPICHHKQVNLSVVCGGKEGKKCVPLIPCWLNWTNPSNWIFRLCLLRSRPEELIPGTTFFQHLRWIRYLLFRPDWKGFRTLIATCIFFLLEFLYATGRRQRIVFTYYAQATCTSSVTSNSVCLSVCLAFRSSCLSG